MRMSNEADHEAKTYETIAESGSEQSVKQLKDKDNANQSSTGKYRNIVKVQGMIFH